jgi:hypothetical protein
MAKIMSVDDAMERLLDDWGWWARMRTSRGQRCLSAEGRYRPERVADEAMAPRMVDEAACLRIEREVTHPHFPKQAHRLLKGWYVKKDSPGHIAAQCAIPRGLVADKVAWARAILRNRLQISLDR